MMKIMTDTVVPFRFVFGEGGLEGIHFLYYCGVIFEIRV